MTHMTRKIARALLIAALLVGGFFTNDALACSRDHVRELSSSGKSVSAIAKMCELTKEQIVRMLQGESSRKSGDEDEPSDVSGDDDGDEPLQPPTGRLPRGAQLTPCGCWGYVSPGAGQRNPSCRSGRERAVACQGVCPAGGSPWARACE